jgi:hypothetical protein
MKHKTLAPSHAATTRPLEPSTLTELLRIAPPQLHHVDVARMNLLCSVGLPDVKPLDVAQHLRTLDIWTQQVSMRTETLRFLLEEHGDELENSEPLWRMYCLTRVLWREQKLSYCEEEKDRDSEADWADSNRHLIHGLLGAQRHGTCASLPVLLVAIGRRLDYPLFLVHSPGHVFCRWDGTGHPNPAWRETRNIEFSGDLDSHPVEYYYHRPVEWPPEWHVMERRRQPWPLYLRSLTPAEELASFLVQRAHAFEAYELFAEAWNSYAAACSLAPHNDAYQHFAKECNRIHMDHVLKPWGITAQQYCGTVEQRLMGVKVPFPWETDDGKPISNNDPFSNPEVASVLMNAQRAVAARLHSTGRLTAARPVANALQPRR